MPLLPLWSFIKEMFFNPTAAALHRRNQMTVLLLLSNFIMFGLLMFSMEQATRQHAMAVQTTAANVKLKETIQVNKTAVAAMQSVTHDLANCENQLSFLASDYRAQARALDVCTSLQGRGKN